MGSGSFKQPELVQARQDCQSAPPEFRSDAIYVACCHPCGREYVVQVGRPRSTGIRSQTGVWRLRQAEHAAEPFPQDDLEEAQLGGGQVQQLACWASK